MAPYGRSTYRAAGVRDDRVLAALRQVPREAFVDEEFEEFSPALPPTGSRKRISAAMLVSAGRRGRLDQRERQTYIARDPKAVLIAEASEDLPPIEDSGLRRRWRMDPALSGSRSLKEHDYFVASLRRTDFGRAHASIRLRTAQPMTASLC